MPNEFEINEALAAATGIKCAADVGRGRVKVAGELIQRRIGGEISSAGVDGILDTQDKFLSSHVPAPVRDVVEQKLARVGVDKDATSHVDQILNSNKVPPMGKFTARESFKGILQDGNPIGRG